MGISTEADVVDYVIEDIFMSNGFHELENDEEFYKLTDVERWVEDFDPAREDLEGISVREWTYEGLYELGKRSRLYGHAWKCGTHTVSLVETSPYASGGASCLAAVSSSKEALIAFITTFSDFFTKNTIEKNVAITQTL